MQLANFTQSNQDPQRPSGPCEVGGRAAHCFFDRSSPDGPAKVTVRFDMTPRAPLPEFARGREALVIAGTEVPVRAAEIEDGSEALQGSLDPALVDAVAGPVAPPDPLAKPAPAPSDSDPGANAGDPDAGDQLVMLSRQHAAAKRERQRHADRVKDLRSETADLRARLEAAETELAAAGDTAAAHAERCAELRQQVRDALDAEEA